MFYKTRTNTEDVGYTVWNQRETGIIFNVMIIVMTVLVMIFVVQRLIMALAIFSHSIKVGEKSDLERTHLYLAIFYVSGIVLVQFIVFDFYWGPEWTSLPPHFPLQTSSDKFFGVYATLRTVLFVFGIITALFGAFVGLCLYTLIKPLRLKHHKPFPLILIILLFSFNCFCIFFFAYIVSRNIVPIMLLAPLNPLNILSLTSINISQVAAIFLAYVLLVFPFITSNETQRYYRCSWSFQNGSFIFASFAATSMLIFYGTIWTSSTSLSYQSGFTQTFAAISASMCAAIFTYIYKTKPFHQHYNKETNAKEKQSADSNQAAERERMLTIQEHSYSSKKPAENTEQENSPLLTQVEIEIDSKDT